MSKDIIYILHEYGEPSHFLGLTYLLEKNNIPYKFYEINFFIQIKFAIKKRSYTYFLKFFRDIWFLWTLPYKKRTKVILSMAPYHNSLPSIRKKLKNHIPFFFISYTCWDQSMYVYDYKNDNILNEWRNFMLNDVKHIFVVSEKTKTEMIKNDFAIDSKVSVVYHSYTTQVYPANEKKKENIFITVSALLPNKGIIELLDIFSKKPQSKLIIVGKGKLSETVKEYASRYPNIVFKGYIQNQSELFEIYKEASFFLLNSKKTATWEELFGMVLIESSACGLVPVAVNHSGPCEIIENGVNGILFPEGEIERSIECCINMDGNSFSKMRKASIENGQKYYVSKISRRWINILD